MSLWISVFIYGDTDSISSFVGPQGAAGGNFQGGCREDFVTAGSCFNSLHAAADARASVIALENLATPAGRREADNEVARAQNIAEFEMTSRRMASSAMIEDLPDAAAAEDLDNAATELTSAALKRRG